MKTLEDALARKCCYQIFEEDEEEDVSVSLDVMYKGVTGTSCLSSIKVSSRRNPYSVHPTIDWTRTLDKDLNVVDLT